MQVHTVLVILGFVLCTDAGYYKGRPPPHYLPKPPPRHFHKPSFHPRRPVPIHAPRNPIRPPPRPFIIKPTPPPPPPFPPAFHSAFRAPVVKETFHSAPLAAYTPDHFLKDDDKGPIHTIPAPNLSPADRPSYAHGQEYSPSPQPPALEAVLQHGLEHVQAKPVQQYQVTEDPSAYKPFSGSPSYFAPDPDPSLPTIEVPQTTDPHSLPSNGQTPLDLYQQQVEEQQQQQYDQPVQQHTYTDGAGNALSPQDLYSLLHGYGQQQQMTPALYQQYLQAAAAQQSGLYQQVFQSGLLYPQQYQHQQQVAQFSQQNFRPQFETFNYNEQTQEGAHGSDSFPSASSLSVGVKRAVSKDTGITGESVNGISSEFKNHHYLEKSQGEESNEVGVISNQVDYDEEKNTEESEREAPSPNIMNNGYYTTLPNKQVAETLATLAAAGSINNQIMKSPTTAGEQEKQEDSDDRQEYTNNMREADEESRRQQEMRIDMSLQHQRNELRVQQEYNEQRQQTYRNHEAREPDNDDVRGPQNYRNYNNIVRTENEKQNQIIANDIREQGKPIQQDNSQSNQQHREQHFPETDYSEEEILDTSDNDQINSNMQIQNGRIPYETTYYRNGNEKKKETLSEEQSYEDTDNDYTQDEEKEINNNNKATKPLQTTEKSVNYNAHQNQLPFGAKLRPKRV